MPASWPVEDFRDYLRTLMTNAGIADYAELSRLSGVSQTQLSNWRRGLSQPSRPALKKLYRHLGLKNPAMLYIAAGLDEHEDLGIEQAPDFTVLPRSFQELIDLYKEIEALGHADEVDKAVRRLVAGLRVEFEPELGRHPTGQRRRAG